MQTTITEEILASNPILATLGGKVGDIVSVNGAEVTETVAEGEVQA